MCEYIQKEQQQANKNDKHSVSLQILNIIFLTIGNVEAIVLYNYINDNDIYIPYFQINYKDSKFDIS